MWYCASEIHSRKIAFLFDIPLGYPPQITTPIWGKSIGMVIMPQV